MWQIIGLGLLAASLWSYVALHNAKQQEIGAAELRAELAEAKAEQEALLVQAAEAARKDAVRQVSILRKRQADTRHALTVAENDRQAANELLARTNAAYDDWRKRMLPDAVPERLRAHIGAISPGPGSDRVP